MLEDESHITNLRVDGEFISKEYIFIGMMPFGKIMSLNWTKYHTIVEVRVLLKSGSNLSSHSTKQTKKYK